MGGRISPLHYGTPLTFSRGEGAFLWAADGTRYLDGYNNVAVVGHAHPVVAAAIGEALAAYNGHSRYLHPDPVRLAERLLATMPAGMDTCLFTTSGSEANELAWRLARAATGGDGAVVVEHAYHGVTTRTADFTSNEWPAGHRPDGVALMRAPHRGEAELTEWEARARVAAAGEELHRSGHQPALVMVDPQFTSEGILDCPREYARGLVEGARQAGALFLADEVQCGFGRSGPQLWRSVVLGIEPDIITLGKPMGAGYPVGAVVTQRWIADALSQRYEYFSTFAGTPAAAAAGNAVLDVLELEGHAREARRIGDALRAGIRALSDRHSRLGEVRGDGLIAGVDIRADDSRAVTRALVDELAATEHVLVGSTGARGDVLKIRPPLVWREEHVGALVAALNRALLRLG